MSPVAFVTDQLSIRRIVDRLGLSLPQQDKPLPAREVFHVAAHGEAGGVAAELD
jgi:hypothetical protein